QYIGVSYLDLFRKESVQYRLNDFTGTAHFLIKCDYEVCAVSEIRLMNQRWYICFGVSRT
ncbi:hypothetical protein L9F63_006591, partial [Diploptera punctata]